MALDASKHFPRHSALERIISNENSENFSYVDIIGTGRPKRVV
jgi:hypothetical protein